MLTFAFSLDSSGLETYEKKHKKQKRHEDEKERKKRKKEKKRKKKSHSPEPPSSGGVSPMLCPPGPGMMGGPAGVPLQQGSGVGGLQGLAPGPSNLGPGPMSAPGMMMPQQASLF